MAIQDVAEFLAGVSPNYEQYAENLQDAGLTSLDMLAECTDADFQHLGVPMFHWRKIMAAIQSEMGEDAAAPGAAEATPMMEPAVEEPAAQTLVSTRDNQFERLQQFYALYNPTKADDTETMNKILAQYQGDYPSMWRHLEQKYILGNKQTVKKRAALDTKPTTKADAILSGIANLYRENIRELEQKYKFPEFHSPLMDDIDFKARPMVLLVGQYSVGKTSFIRYLLNRDFPGARIGPEPTTDSFMAIMHNQSERVIPGNAAVMDRSLPFRTLQRFGIQFLNKFSVSQLPAPILESITFIDTPGILSGEKQRLGRQYDFASVVEQFAHRADRVLLLFDAHKLDISDEFRQAIEMLKGHDDKVRCILNKCDQVPNQQLLRVYGALMWSLGKVFRTPEVLRVYVGSFWDQPYSDEHNADLFDAEAQDLISDLKALPRHRVTRKINEFVKRTRQFKVHLLIIEHLRAQFGWTGKETKQRKLLAGMEGEFRALAERHHLTLADFPNPKKFASLVKNHQIWEFGKLKQKTVDNITRILEEEVTRLMTMLPGEGDGNSGGKGGVGANPFAEQLEDEAQMDPTKRWVVNAGQKAEYDNLFYGLEIVKGQASGAQVRSVMMQSGFDNTILMAIWELADITNTGALDGEEFALCCWLIDFVKAGNQLPRQLTVNMVPPGKRSLVEFS